MNKERRKAIQAALAKLAEARSELEMVRDEEQEAFDALSESFQSSERGEAMQAAIDNLEQACSQVEEAEHAAEDAMQ